MLLHHNRRLVHSVLDQLEACIIDEQHSQCAYKQYNILQSKRRMARFISQNSVFDGDVSRVIVDFNPPPFVVMRTHFDRCQITLSFHDHFVDFDCHSLVDFACKYHKAGQAQQTCFVYLFDEKEARLFTSTVAAHSNQEIIKVYGFLTRFYSSVFDQSHHIHLFAKHHRADIDEGRHDKQDADKHGALPLLIQMKSMNVYATQRNQQRPLLLKNHQITTSHLSSMRVFAHLLASIVRNNKVAPMSMYDVNVTGSVSLVSKIKLRLSVVHEIRASNASNQYVADLVDHILKRKPKYQSNSRLRLSFSPK